MSHAFRASKQSALVYLACGLLATAAFAQKPDPAAYGRNYDARIAEPTRAAVAPSAAQQAAIDSLRATVPYLTVEVEATTGATRKLFNQVGFLTGPNTSADNKQVALDFLAANLDLLGITAADLANYEITDDVPANLYVAKPGFARMHLETLSSYGIFDPRQFAGQHLIEAPVDLADCFAFNRLGFSQTAAIDPLLNCDVGARLELQITLSGIVTVVVLQRSLDLYGMRVMPFDQVRVIAVRRTDQICKGGHQCFRQAAFESRRFLGEFKSEVDDLASKTVAIP